jgi:membrane-associated phospholipid phosphatase
MERPLARAISTIFGPQILAILGAFVLVAYRSPVDFLAYLIFLFVGGGLPTVTFFIEYFQGKQKELNIARRDRDSIYLAGLFGFAITSVLVGSAIVMSALWMLISMVMAIYFGLFYVVNRYFTKASQHMGMICFWSVLLMDKVSLVFILVLALAPVVAWSRVYLHRHTWEQIAWGGAIGLSTGLLTWVF